jgi:hypothetical protein
MSRKRKRSHPKRPAPAAANRVAPVPEKPGARSLEVVLFLIVLAAAAWLRLAHLDLCEFKGDELEAVERTLPIVQGGAWPQIGLRSSVGVNNPPFLMVLLALPLSVKVDPLLAAGFVALVGTIAAAVLFFVLRRQFGAFPALVAMALFATAPWAVLRARKIWSVDLFPIFTVALLHCLFVVLRRPRTWLALGVPVLLCALWQLHFSASALLAVAGGVLLLRVRQLRWTAVAPGVALSLLMLVPYLRYQADHGWQDFELIGQILHGTASLSEERDSRLLVLAYTGQLTGALGWDYVTGPSESDFAGFAPVSYALGRGASVVVVLLMSGGFLASALRLARRVRFTRRVPFLLLPPEEEARGLLVLWLGGIWALFFAAHLAKLYPHYFLVAYPVPFALAALALEDLRSSFRPSLRRRATVAAATLTAAIAVAYVAFDFGFTGFLREHGGTAGDYGVAYTHKAAVARFALCEGLNVAPEGGAVEVPALMELQRDSGVAPGSCSEGHDAGRTLVLRDRLLDPEPLPCAPGGLRSFGPLDTCLNP